MVKKHRRHRKPKSHFSKNKFTYGIIAFIIFIICCLSLECLKQQPIINDGPIPLKAAIVDHLSLFEPNKKFIQTATDILEESGFEVEYYPGEEVTVDFFRNLPEHGYGLIVLRVHSALSGPERDYVGLFTSEIYSRTKYVGEQFSGRIGAACFRNPPPYWFGINPSFIESSTKGRFQNTIVLMLGCEGLTYDKMAKAFIKKGAKTYISWDKGVLANHTDRATLVLLKHLISEKRTIKQSVTMTMREVGPDPMSESVLRYYPEIAEDYSIVPSLIINTAETWDSKEQRRHDPG